jgi:hypothetical protein
MVLLFLEGLKFEFQANHAEMGAEVSGYANWNGNLMRSFERFSMV